MRARHPKLNRTTLAMAGLLASLASAPASAASCTWNSTNGNWNELAKWLACVTGNGNPVGVPGAADSASIGAAGVVTVNSAQRVGALANAGNLIVDTGSGTLRVTGGITGSGTTTIQGDAILALEGTQTVGGNANIVFGTSNNNRLNVEGTNAVVTLGAGTTVRGQTGVIGDAVFVGGSGRSVVNQGLISSDSGGTITIRSLSSLSNQNILEANNAGSQVLFQNDIINTGATIRATNGGVIQQQGVAVTGGTITTSGGGSYRMANNGNNFLNGLTLSTGSLIDLAAATSIARVTGGITIDGAINLNNNSILAFQGNNTISGSGAIVLGNVAGNRIALDGTGTTTLAAGTTIRGHSGSIGGAVFLGGTQALVNNGTISADVAGGTISIGTHAVTNNGTLSALNGGTLSLNSNVAGGALGQLVAGAGSTVLQNGITISGIVNTSGSGRFAASNNGNNFLDGVTLNGNLDLATATSIERVTAGGLVLNGTININNNSILAFTGDGGLSGNATIVLGNTGGSNRITLDGTGTTTFAAGTTVRGENGTIGGAVFVGGTQALVNNGTISADVAGGTISIGTHAVTNNGTLSALNGGTLSLNSNVAGGAFGQLVAGAGSTVLQNGITISGIVNTSGSGRFAASNNGNNILDGVTLNGNLDLATATSIERVTAGGLVLNGTINLNNNSILAFTGDGGLSGNATIVLGNTGGSNRIALDGTGTTTFATGTTVRGENGTIGGAVFVGGTQALVNNGTISADVAGGTITISTHPVTNNGTMSALNGGTLVLSSNVTGNPGGQIVSGAGSTVLQNGVTLSGTINTSGSGRFAATNNGNNFLSGVTLNGNLDLATATSIERVTAGGLVLNGAINLNSNSILSFQGTGGLSGNGTIVLGNSGGSNRVALDGAGTTTFAAGTTVRGHSGTIGGAVFLGGTHTLVNNGTFNADVAGGTITVSGTPLVNNGLVRAQAGTMNVSTALTGTGTLQVDATGAMNLAAGAKSQGTLAMGAAGAALNLNTGNLTISSDYTNVGAGTGNSFNRRAGVSGTGQIVAGGDVSQVITGAAVTGGATTNATLTLGNVRVGANTFNVQIGNAGTTGPTLRGAIQTNVGGGNITDTRLSGTGVTASNYNAGAPGGNSGNLGVTFTAASAGALAPLTGQAINLRSNFDNIADQKLNIVLAGGAAAYNAAVGSTTPTPVVLANQRVGGSLTQALTVNNTAAAGAFSEDLRATFGTNTGAVANNGGSINALVSGGSNASAMNVSVNTATSGAKTGSVTINYDTTGTVGGVSNGLGVAGANPAQVINVSGNVYQAAAGQLISAPLNFGTVQVGQTVTQNLVVRNTATGAAGFVEDLQASFGASTGTGAGLISGSGSLNGILAGTNSTAGNGVMTVAVNTGAAGVVNGNIAVNYTSAGTVAGNSNGLGTLAVGSEAFGVQGQINTVANVINQASPLVNTPTINLGAVRVGAAAPSGTVSVSNVATAAPQAALNASIAATSGPITASGSFALLNPGGTNNSSLVVGLNTGTAGNFTGANAGTATISLVSDANNVGGCGANCQLNLTSQVVNVEGKVYTAAVGSASGTSINFGVVRVGDTVSAANITINNTAATTALNDTLRADLSGLSGPISGNGNVSGIAAQGSGQLAVGLNTSTAGIFSQTGSLGFTSQNADMADVSAGAAAGLSVFAQVNNLANGDFDLDAGAGNLSQTGTSYVLDLGTIVLGSSVSSSLSFDNDVGGPADALSGSFDLTGADDFALSGWNPLAFLGAGQAGGAMTVNWLAGALGLFSDTIVFNGVGTNASDPLGLAQTRQLVIRANVIQGGGGGNVPEPGTLALLLSAAAAAVVSKRRAAVRKGVVQ